MLISLLHLPHVSSLTNPCLLVLLPFTFGLILAGEMKDMNGWGQAAMVALVSGFCWISEPSSRPYLLLAAKLLYPVVASFAFLAAVLYVAAIALSKSSIRHR